MIESVKIVYHSVTTRVQLLLKTKKCVSYVLFKISYSSMYVLYKSIIIFRPSKMLRNTWQIVKYKLKKQRKNWIK